MVIVATGADRVVLKKRLGHARRTPQIFYSHKRALFT